MNSLFLGTLTFLVALPAISICDEDLTKASKSPSMKSEEEETITRNPLSQFSYDDEFDYLNEIEDPWAFYRQLRAPSGFSAVRGKKAYEPENYWELNVNIYFRLLFIELKLILIPN